MKNVLIVVVFVGLLASCKSGTKQKEVVPEQTAALEEGWTDLFDGESFKGWHTYLRDTISTQWQIKDGVMFYKPDPDKAQGMNNLITDQKYTNYELSLDWKISVDGNSGVFYGVLEDEKFVVPYMTAPEIQIRDYTNIPDFTDHQQMSGAIFGIVGIERDVAKKAGEWNHFLIKIDHKNNVGSVTLNEVEVANFPVNGDAWNTLVASSKFKDWEGFGITREGHIGLQDHAHGVWFRNIKIKELVD
ncbi:3-keto-disaccharide hydrolase [Lutimonas sp.]|uniref:3-keto-disaccharide hydrolase n=1 Tax=Lutimonas sp. TaxID=1872403 RepID=UPI003D9AE439